MPRSRFAFIPLIILFVLATWIPVEWSQQKAAGNASGQSQFTVLKQAMVANHQKLMKYQWVQSTEVSVKGKVRKDQQAQCRYGVDGKVIKTPIGVSPSEQAQETPDRAEGRIRGRIIAKKKEEMQDETERLKALISNYAPPDPQMIKAAKQAGNSNINASGGIVTLSFTDYFKPGDRISFGFDPAAKRLVSYDVNTYLDNPNSDRVTMANRFDTLPDGTNYLNQTVVDAQSKQIKITITNSGYTPLAQ